MWLPYLLLAHALTGLGAATPVLIPTNGTTEANIQEDQNYTILALSLFEDDAEELTGSSIMLVRLPEVGQALVDQLTGNIIYTSNPNDPNTCLLYTSDAADE